MLSKVTGDIRSVVVAGIEIDALASTMCHSTADSVGGAPHHLTTRTKWYRFQCHLNLGNS